MKYLLLSIFAVLALAGCAASPDYAKYADANQQIETARHNADAAKYKAMADIAAQGDSSAKVAAVMAMAMAGQGAAAAGSSLRAPEPNQALQWASILVPSLTQVVGMRYNFLTAATQSNNATALGISTNGTFASMAGSIQAPAANVTTTLSGTGTVGGGDYTTSANPILSGTGTIGGGAYSTVDTHAVDNHTISPTPVIVNPPVVITPYTKVCTSAAGVTSCI